jgi:hypothetical protein
MGFNELRNEEARSRGFRDYADYRNRLSEGAEDEISGEYPYRISIAEPDATNPSATGGAG